MLSSKISSQQAKNWTETDPMVWIAESAKIRSGLYPAKNTISWDYQYQAIPIVKRQLQMGGVRIAAYLNALFKEDI